MKKITGEDPTPRQFVESSLPEHYTVIPGIEGVIDCKSSQGIEDESEWVRFMNGLRNYFGDSFKEVYHHVCYNHQRFTVYYDYYKLNNIDHNHKLLPKDQRS